MTYFMWLCRVFVDRMGVVKKSLNISYFYGFQDNDFLFGSISYLWGIVGKNIDTCYANRVFKILTGIDH